ncbi:MAG TPA: hypothetical protein VJK73_01255 [Candidatus Paceibacterota bacterium]
MDGSVPEQLVPPQMPSKKQQSWGAFISIVVIVLMVIVGAFYAWGKRVAEVQEYQNAANASEATTTTP